MLLFLNCQVEQTSKSTIQAFRIHHILICLYIKHRRARAAERASKLRVPKTNVRSGCSNRMPPPKTINPPKPAPNPSTIEKTYDGQSSGVAGFLGCRPDCKNGAVWPGPAGFSDGTRALLLFQARSLSGTLVMCFCFHARNLLRDFMSVVQRESRPLSTNRLPIVF